MAPNVLRFQVEARTSAVTTGTAGAWLRLKLMRVIGGAERMKWKKPNDFNGSEWSVKGNSLDLAENGPLY